MYNIVLYQELIAAGLTTTTIRRARSCCLLRLCRGVYSIVRDCRQKSHGRIIAMIDDPAWIEFHVGKTQKELREDFEYQTLLRRIRILSYQRYRPDDVISGTSAAVLHGIPLYGELSGPLAVLHPTSNSKSREIVRVLRSVPEPDRQRVDHLIATAPIRTSLDLVGVRGQRDAFAAMEWVLRRSVFVDFPHFDPKFGYPPGFSAAGHEQIRALWLPAIERLDSGQKTAQRMAEALRPLSESLAESFCSFNLHALGVAGFDQQVNMHDDRGFIARVDFVHEATRTIVEVDGDGKYVKLGRALVRKESEQRNRLLALGYKVIHFSFKDLLNLSGFSAKLYSQAPDLRRHSGARSQLASPPRRAHQL